MTDPSLISGKTLWLRAKDCGTGSVTTWVDQSGLGKNGISTGTAPTVAAASTPSGGKSLAFTGGWFNVPSGMFPFVVTSSTFLGAGYEPERAMDGGSGTYWCASGNSGWLRSQWAVAPVVTSYTILNQSTFPTRAPRTWTFEGSNDGTTFTTLDTRSAITFVDGTAQTFSFTNSTAYTYYRLNVSVNNGDTYLSIAELNFNGTTNSPPLGEMWGVVKSSGDTGAPFHVTDDGDDRYTFGGQIYDNFANVRVNFTPTLAVTSWRLFRARVDASGRTWYLDTVSQFTTAAVTTKWSYQARIGSGQSAAFTGNIAEVVLFNKNLSPSETSGLIDYFNTEHGLTLPGGNVSIEGWGVPI